MNLRGNYAISRPTEKDLDVMLETAKIITRKAGLESSLIPNQVYKVEGAFKEIIIKLPGYGGKKSATRARNPVVQ